jgi:hypothetical protein
MAGRQLNIRLDPAAADELEVHAFLRRQPAANVARDVIMEFLEARRDEPGMETARRARAEYEAGSVTEDPKVRQLRHRHSNHSQ